MSANDALHGGEGCGWRACRLAVKEGQAALRQLLDGVSGAQIVTISGRTIRKEALASPELAVSAIRHIEDLLALVPRDALKQAEAFRSQRRGVSA